MLAQILVFSLGATAETYRCDISEKHVCDQGSGCQSVPSTIWNTVDTTRRTFSRCDRNGCDTYAATFTTSGLFTVIDVTGRGLIAKMAVDGSLFVEITTLGTQAFVSFGQCQK